MPSGRLLTTVHRRLLMDGLRRELGKLDGDCNLTFENIELLRPKYKHTIQLVEGWPEEFEEQPPFTCVMELGRSIGDALRGSQVPQADTPKPKPSRHRPTGPSDAAGNEPDGDS